MGIVEEASPEDRVLEKSPRPMDDPTDGAAANSGEDDNGASPPALSRTPKAPPRPPVATASECGSFSDDSEWCVYRRACLAVGTLGLVLLDAAPYAPDTSFRRGRSDDSMFVPTSLDRRRASGEGLSFSVPNNNELPHRSTALARRLGAASFADAERRGAVAWYDPGADDSSSDDGSHSHNKYSSSRSSSSSNNSSRSHDSSSNGRAKEVGGGRVGLLFVDSPENVYHAAAKAFQLSYAASEASARLPKTRHLLLDAVVPLSCTRGACQPSEATHGNAPAKAWLRGLLAVLFPTTEAVHDPKGWASANHRRAYDAAAKASADGSLAREPPPLELLCFAEVVVPGESRALFRGPTDARRFRFMARRFLGLSPVALQPLPKVSE
jgi:hypothetical protein